MTEATPSEFFSKAFKDLEKSPVYWAEGFKIEITETLYGRMEEMGLNQNKLAKRLGVNRAWVSRFFQGKEENLTLLTIAKVALALGMRPKLSLAHTGHDAPAKGG